jgi:hypothetical protein
MTVHGQHAQQPSPLLPLRRAASIASLRGGRPPLGPPHRDLIPGRPHGGTPRPQLPPHASSRGAPPLPSLRCGVGRPPPGPPHRNLVHRGTRPRRPASASTTPPLPLLLRGETEPLLKKPATAAGVKQGSGNGRNWGRQAALDWDRSLSTRSRSPFNRLVQQRQQAVGLTDYSFHSFAE